MNILIGILIGVGIVVGLAILAVLLSMHKSIKKREESRDKVWSPPLQARIEQTQMMGRELTELGQIMREKAQRENDKELAEYAASHKRQQPINDPFPTAHGDDRVHQTNPKAEKILIPEGLSEEEKAALKEFYNL